MQRKIAATNIIYVLIPQIEIYAKCVTYVVQKFFRIHILTM